MINKFYLSRMKIIIIK